MTSGTTSAAANTTPEQDRLRTKFWKELQINKRMQWPGHNELWDWLQLGWYTALAGWQLEAGKNLFFRGQSDIAYGLTSSLYRQIRGARPNAEIGEQDLRLAETALLGQMRREGLGRNMSDFELVTVLQHHLMPTRLIDVSRTPMEGLYFAVEGNHGTDGVLFIINPHDDGALDYEGEDLPWAHFRATKRYGDSGWTNRVSVANHRALDPRMTAQNGTFLLGGLLRSYSGVTMNAGDETIPKEIRTDVTNLAVRFYTTTRQAHGEQWGASGWVVRIPAEWKRDLRDRLRLELNIGPDTMYPAFDEAARLAKFVVTQSAEA